MKKWTTEEDLFLKENYGKIKTIEISKFLNRSLNGISNRAIKLNIKINDYSFRKKNTVNMNFFESPNIENSYWAGFIAADGNVSPKGNSLRILLAAKDKEHLEKFARATQFSGTIVDSSYVSKSFSKGKTLYKSVISIWGVKKWLNNLEEIYSIIPRKTLILEPPKLEELEHKLAYIIGYIDGDGCIRLDTSNNRKTLRIVIIGTYNLMTWIKDILDKECPPKNKVYTNVYKTGNIYRLNFGGSRAIKIFKRLLEINCQYRMNRKWKILEGFE